MPRGATMPPQVTNSQLSAEIEALRVALLGSANGSKVTLAGIQKDIEYLGKKIDVLCATVKEHGVAIHSLELSKAQLSGKADQSQVNRATLLAAISIVVAVGGLLIKLFMP